MTKIFGATAIMVLCWLVYGLTVMVSNASQAIVQTVSR